MSTDRVDTKRPPTIQEFLAAKANEPVTPEPSFHEKTLSQENREALFEFCEPAIARPAPPVKTKETN